MTVEKCLENIHTLKTRYEYFKAWWVPHTGFVHAFLIDRDPAVVDADPIPGDSSNDDKGTK